MVVDQTNSAQYGMSMDVHETEVVVRRLASELAEQRELAASASRNVSAIAKILAGYVEMYPELGYLVEDLPEPEYDSDGTPRGIEAVRIILQERTNQWLLVSELVDALRDRGWLPDSDNPANAVRTALWRLVNTPESDVRKGRKLPSKKVVYSYRPDDPPPDERPPDPEPTYDDEEPF